jgi:hypothetical protein
MPGAIRRLLAARGRFYALVPACGIGQIDAPTANANDVAVPAGIAAPSPGC